MRRDAFEKTRGFEGSYVVDLAMWFDLLEYGSAVKNIRCLVLSGSHDHLGHFVFENHR
jgi:hypothetical protein